MKFTNIFFLLSLFDDFKSKNFKYNQINVKTFETLQHFPIFPTTCLFEQIITKHKREIEWNKKNKTLMITHKNTKLNFIQGLTDGEQQDVPLMTTQT